MERRTMSRTAQPRRTMVWTTAWAVVLLATGASLAQLGAPHPRGTAAAAAAPEAVLAQTFTAAWNAGDAAAAAVLFAPGAQVRHRNARVVRHGGNVDVSDVYGVELTYEGDPPRL